MRHAGAFVYGRTRVRRTLQGIQQERVPQDKWHTLLLGSHLGYISREEYQENQRRLRRIRMHSAPSVARVRLVKVLRCCKV
jgi:hypothetical protein